MSGLLGSCGWEFDEGFGLGVVFGRFEEENELTCKDQSDEGHEKNEYDAFCFHAKAVLTARNKLMPLNLVLKISRISAVFPSYHLPLVFVCRKPSVN